MGYLGIPNLTRRKHFMRLCDRVYATEKIHGTSASITLRRKPEPNDAEAFGISYYPGGTKLEEFSALFSEQDLLSKVESALAYVSSVMAPVGPDGKIPRISVLTIHGEAYGGKMHRMAHTYGDHLRFVAFEVRVNEHLWLDVPRAANVARLLSLDFVHYEEGPNTADWLTQKRDEESMQAIKNGVGHGRPREGIVVRPLHETLFSNGARAIVKYVADSFRETKSVPKLKEPEKTLAEMDAEQIADEWVMPMRLEHVMDDILAKRENKTPLKRGDIREVLTAVVADVKKECDDTIQWDTPIYKAVKAKAALIFKEMIATSPPSKKGEIN